jgi:hypothetical protein
MLKPQLATQLDELGLKAVRFARRIDDALTIAQQVLVEAEAAVEAAAEALAGARVGELLDQPICDYLVNLVFVEQVAQRAVIGWRIEIRVPGPGGRHVRQWRPSDAGRRHERAACDTRTHFAS